MEGCLACELTTGLRDLPGGRIHETPCWIVEHCVGPLGVGALIVKPKRHITRVWELDGSESHELGPLLQRVAAALQRVLEPEQIYVNLWSHSGGTPVHIHWVLQPIAVDRPAGLLGPHLQAAMFDLGELPPVPEVEVLAGELRAALQAF